MVLKVHAPEGCSQVMRVFMSEGCFNAECVATQFVEPIVHYSTVALPVGVWASRIQSHRAFLVAPPLGVGYLSAFQW